ncbi:MAG: hypothetical protein U1D69_03590 [Polynucleobacter sp.]|jgi:hypothetical protein|uniref:hypothetical protein n=1 Tax=Hydrocarboniphaga effusa TaxID=243629 RepID=UPI002AB8B498|nr:hypothetical protein [Polynucleobacter sp.]
MSQNLVSLDTLHADLPEIDAALAVLEQKFSTFISLSADERQALHKMGDVTEPFCRQTISLLAQNPAVVPPSLDVEEAQRDLADIDALRPRIARLTKLLRLADDTEIALGSDVQVAASAGHKFLTLAGKGQGLETLLKNIPARRQKRRSSKPVETPPV